jgi:hypothetical protein
MVDFLRRHRLIVSMIGGVVGTPAILLAVVLTYDLAGVPIARVTGELAAELDVHSGTYRELGYGLAFVSDDTYAGILHSRYAEAEFVRVAGCVVSPQLQTFIRGYNQVSQRAARRHFGKDIFEEAAKEAERTYEADPPTSRPKS